MSNIPSTKDVDDLVYALRQKGADSTYALVVEALAKWGTPQPGVRETLTREQALKIVEANPDAMCAIRMTEAAHGIGIEGGQHGTE